MLPIHAAKANAVMPILSMATTYVCVVVVAIVTVLVLATMPHPQVVPRMVPTCPVSFLPGCHTL